MVNSTDSPSVFTLSRTVRLTDSTFVSSPETGAKVSVEGENGDIHNFFELPGGIYQSSPLSLNTSSKYRLKITTSSGEDYASDFVEAKQTPPIDSLTWQQQNDVMIYLDTHDPLNNTRYYRWDFTETYQYEAPLNAELSQDNGNLYYVDNTPNQTYDCWRSVNSTEILLGSSIALGQDVISKAPINIVPQNSQDITIKYSILVKQYALTRDAYQYFSILKKNTENLGSIFDAQPTQLTGNIHSVKNPGEVVIGFFSPHQFSKKEYSSQNMMLQIGILSTPTWSAALSPLVIIHYLIPGFLYGIILILSITLITFVDPHACLIARRECVDCRVRGGTNQKPSYW